MTYSIVARDHDSGRFGVAVQSCWPFVGASCPWVEVGVGAVVTQSYTEVAHGPNGLWLMRGGATARDALARLLEADDGREVRQVGVVDATGQAGAHTGSRCVEAAGHAIGDGVTVQANMMERPTVWGAMLGAFAGSSGAFVDRLIAALRAAEAEGGDIRGRQSAVVVISGAPGEPAWTRQIDIRVDDHPAPLDELDRLLGVQRAYDSLDRAEQASNAGDLDTAIAAWDEAGRLAPGDAQVDVWRALADAAAGRLETAGPLFQRAVATNPRWPEFVERFARSGVQPELVDAANALLEAESARG